MTVTVVVSLAWMIAITLTPAADRPYADGSQNNSVFAQVFVYNGVERFTHDPAYGLGNERSYSPSARRSSLPPTVRQPVDRFGLRRRAGPGCWCTTWVAMPAGCFRRHCSH